MRYTQWEPWLEEAREVYDILCTNPQDPKTCEIVQLAHALGCIQVAVKTDVRLYTNDLSRREAISRARQKDETLLVTLRGHERGNGSIEDSVPTARHTA